MKGCLRPPKKAFKWTDWLEDRLLKFWSLETREDIKKVGELWGCGQIRIELGDGEWRGLIEKCKFDRDTEGKILIRDKTVDLKVSLHWFAHKKVTNRQDAHLINRTTFEWDRIAYPYELELTLTKVQQTKTKPRRLYFETVKNEWGYFSLRTDPENISWNGEKIHDPLLQLS